jgi:hypothetical protein
MVGPWPFRPYTFRALVKTFGPLWVRCDVCRRYARLSVGGELVDADYRSKTFSCSVCGSTASLCVVEPTHERDTEDYRLDERRNPERHPSAVDRLTGRTKRRHIDFSHRGEQPGRKVDPRR